MPTRLLASAHSCALRAQLSLEGLGSASNLLLLTGVGSGLVASYLSGLKIDGGLSLASNERLRHAGSSFADGMAIGVETR